MQLHKYLMLISICGASGCGGSSSGSSTPEQVQEPLPTPAQPPLVIDDVVCSASYPLIISAATTEANNTDLSNLFDGNKTNSSNWQGNALDTSVIFTLAHPALLKKLVITWKDIDVSHFYSISASKDQENWQTLVNQEQSTQNKLIPDLIDLTELTSSTALFLKVIFNGTELSQPSNVIEVEAFGCEQEVEHNIELIDWYLSVPTDEDNNGKSDSIKEDDLANDYFDSRFFTLSQDGGITFSTSVSGYRTSTNTNYVRTELREMLRRGNTNFKTQGVNENNWVFHSAPQSDLDNAGGIDGELQAELSVNHVTSTGEDYQIGRVIIGQIHANDDEPVRLYYRKLPNNTNGSIYIAHEVLDGDDFYFELIGSRSNSASNPTNGIPLNERFSYSITVEGNTLIVTIVKADGSEYTQSVDMSNSGYDQGGQYMYFKAGVYNQNNSGDPHDYVRATFYKIENSHTGYAFSNN